MSQITELISAYVSGALDFPTLRQSIRNVTPAPIPPSTPWVQDDDPPVEGTALEVLAAAFTFDLTPDEYHQILLSLHGQPIPISMPVDTMDPGLGMAPDPQLQAFALSNPLPSGPMRIFELLAPLEPDRQWLAPITADAAQSPETVEKRRRLSRMLKHYSETHPGTGTTQEVHDPQGGGGGGEAKDSGSSSDRGPSGGDAKAQTPSAPGKAPRPGTFDAIVGQDRIKSQAEIMVKAARKRGEAAPHMLFTGPPGLGKTTFARAVVNEMGSRLVGPIIGGNLKTADDVSAILSQLQDGDILFIDEIHAMSPAAQEILYPAIEDFEMTVNLGGYTTTVELPPFTLLGATTNPEGVLAPLRDRFGGPLQFEFYEPEDLAQISANVAKGLGFDLPSDAAMEIARRGRGTPRAVVHLTNWIRDYATAYEQPITSQLVSDALAMREIDSLGLTVDDRRVLQALQSSERGTMGLNNLAAATGLDESTIQSAIEPYLIRSGLVERTGSGRRITSAGIDHLTNVTYSKAAGTFRVVKSDSRKNLVFGWANVAFTEDGQVEDHQGHLIDLDDLENAAYNFVVKYRLTGDMHDGDGFGELVESLVVTEDKVAKAGFPPAMLGHWWVGFRVPPEHQKRVDAGERMMFSIQGKAHLEPVVEDVAKHASPIHPGTGTGQEVHDRKGGGGSGKTTKYQLTSRSGKVTLEVEVRQTAAGYDVYRLGEYIGYLRRPSRYVEGSDNHLRYWDFRSADGERLGTRKTIRDAALSLAEKASFTIH